MYSRNANNSAVIEPVENLTECRDDDGPYLTLLWAMVGQAVEDACQGGWCTAEKCPYSQKCRYLARQGHNWQDGSSPSEAMDSLRFILGDGHRIVRQVEKLRRECKRIHVNLHYQDNRDGTGQARDKEGRWTYC